ncbi:unnamed protein product [Cylicostephanus goldi]|uniref:Uncharacterized protein n=1 Tax=Cylicostephanus goldi TaxID=71465 RepID=A0A3P6QV89_CYLGO|nr:unnamed protein product [Cylicostephanus goldi]
MSGKYAAKYGFDKMPNYKHDMDIIIPKGDPEYITKVFRIPKQCKAHAVFKNFKDVDEKKLAAYDSSVNRLNRADYLLNFITTINSLNKSGDVVGYCCIRSVLMNYLSVSPLYADNDAVARTLLAEVLPIIAHIKMYRHLKAVYPAANEQMSPCCLIQSKIFVYSKFSQVSLDPVHLPHLALPLSLLPGARQVL